MFNVLKYLYYKSDKNQKVDQKIDDEPEIINSYDTEYINLSCNNLEVSKFTKIDSSDEINSLIENTKNSPFVNAVILPEHAVSTQNNISPLTKNILKKLNKVYLVLKKNTGEPLGIYNSLAKAKEHGQKATYHNCQILEYQINDPCKYLKDPVFENNN